MVNLKSDWSKEETAISAVCVYMVYVCVCGGGSMPAKDSGVGQNIYMAAHPS